MPYKIDYIPDENGLILQWTGHIKADEVVRSYHERYAPRERLKKLRYIITDYTNMCVFDLEPHDIRTIAEITNKAAAGTNNNILAAAIMPTDIAYGLARMFQSYADDDTTGWRTLVTRTRKEAYDWLCKNLNQPLRFSNPANGYNENQ